MDTKGRPTSICLFNCDNTCRLDPIESLLLTVQNDAKMRFAVNKRNFRLDKMSEMCETVIPGLQMDFAVFAVNARESRLSINEDNAGIGYAKIYRALLKATGGKVLIVIGGDNNYKDSDEEDRSVISRWARRKVASQFGEEYLDGRQSFIFSWNMKHREIHEQALLHYFDPSKTGKKFEYQPKPKPQPQEQEYLQRQLKEMAQQLRNVKEDLRVKEQQLKENVIFVQKQFQENDKKNSNLQNQVTTLKKELEDKDQEINELETSLLTAQNELREFQRQQSPEWVISRDQIQLTDKFLGKGGWGSVVEGKYCGCSVAVKKMHDLILSPHNRKKFEREIDIASRCRHPCLLQFIGATNDIGNPLLVSELMETSLRALLEQRALSMVEVFAISLDVARALNYLHQKQPSPIIHRDISSANVLLWRQGEQWRGKVSDYGTANIMQHTMSVAPGAMVYSAPEAYTKNQTVKIDVYSFGVLLCETCIQEFPDPQKRDQQVAMVTDKLHRALIRRCLRSESEARPSTQEIIDELEGPYQRLTEKNERRQSGEKKETRTIEREILQARKQLP